MYKLLYIILFFIFLPGILFCDELSEYTIYKINDIPSGKEKGLIGWEPAVAGGFSGPTSFAINDTFIYVPDRVNYRVNVYDHNFNFIKTINEEGKKNAHFALNLKTDNLGNLYYSFADLGLIKINNKGKQIFMINHIELPEQVKSYNNFFPIDEYLFIYNDKNEVEYIDNSGKIEGPEKALAVLQEISKDKEQLQINSTNESKLQDEKKQIIKNLRNSKKYLLVDDNFYSTNFRKNKEYFEQVKDIREYVKSEKVKDRSGEEKKEVNLNIEDFSIHFFDYDTNHNSYWMGIIDKPNRSKKYAVIIYSKYGELLDAFYYGQYIHDEKPGLQPDFSQYPTSGAEVAVAPSGDVYFLVGSKEKYTLYKVSRQW